MAEKSESFSSVMHKTAQTRQGIADRVNDSLPTLLDSGDVDKHPEFVKLMTSLSHKLNEDGVQKGTANDLKSAEAALKHEKRRWLEQHILYHELKELLLDQDMVEVEGTPRGTVRQFYNAVRDCLSLAEAQAYLRCNPDPTSQATLLGLTEEDFKRRNPHKKHLQSIQQKLIPEVEERLRKKCEGLVNYHDSITQSQSDSGEFTFAKASQLPGILENEKQQIETEKRQLKCDRQSRVKQFNQYHKALMESLGILEQLITRHRLCVQKENDTATGEWLAARCDALCVKIKVIEAQLLCDTYYVDTVEALRKARDELDLKITGTKQELTQMSQVLKSYEAAGQGYDELVQVYTRLTQEIDNKRWTMRELSHSLPS